MYRRKFRVRRQGVRKALNKARYTRKPKAIINAVSKVNKKVTRLARILPPPNRLFYQIANTQTMVGPYVSHNIMRFNQWGRIFGTNVDDETTRSARLRSFRTQHYLTCLNVSQLDSIQPIAFTYFLVKLTKKGSYLLDESNGELKTLTSNVHYVSSNNVGSLGVGGMTLLNKEYFKILKYKRIHLGNQYVAMSGGPQTQDGTDRRWDDKMKLGFDVTNPASSDWKTSIMPQSPQQNIFQILFLDNVLVDRQPRWTTNTVISVDTY